MKCRACGSPQLQYNCHVETVPDRYWLRCHDCGSLTSTYTYAETSLHYVEAYIRANTDDAGRVEHQKAFWYHRDTFERLAAVDRTFLDVGCLEGVGMDTMRLAGWDCWGFDVIAGLPEYVASRSPESVGRIKIAADFRADRFDRQFGAILSSETIEHVERPVQFTRELAAALLPGGTLIIQTPRESPVKRTEETSRDEPELLWDQWAHLTCFSERALRKIIHDAGLEIDDTYSRVWPTAMEQRRAWGQLYVCRKTPSSIRHGIAHNLANFYDDMY